MAAGEGEKQAPQASTEGRGCALLNFFWVDWLRWLSAEPARITLNPFVDLSTARSTCCCVLPCPGVTVPALFFGKVGRGRPSLAGHAHNSRVNPSLRFAALRRHLQRSRLSRRTMPLQRTLRARGSTAAVWAGGVGAVPCQGCRPTGGAGA